MFEKIEIFDKRYSELSQRLYEPSVAADPEQYQKTMKELKSIEEIVLTYREYKQAVKSQDESIEILEESGDSDLKELAQLELDEAKQNIEELSEKLKILLLPKDPNDERNVIVEIRGGAGGEESALFSAVLFRMYSMYAEKKGYKVEIVNANETELGGYKEISFMIEGEDAYIVKHKALAVFAQMDCVAISVYHLGVVEGELHISLVGSPSNNFL